MALDLPTLNGAARGEFVQLLNNDTEVPPGALDTLAAYLEEHPKVGAVQPLLVRHDDRNLIDSSGVELFSLPGARDRQIERPVDEAPRAPERVFGACAAQYSMVSPTSLIEGSTG